MATADNITRGLLTREQFIIRLDHIEMEMNRAMKSVRTLQLVSPTAREIAMQRTMNIMVEDLIVQLEMETNITVEATREDRMGNIPCPPMLKRHQTLLNFDNNR